MYKELEQEWSEHLNEALDTTEVSGHPYEETAKNLIREALCFWSFLKNKCFDTKDASLIMEFLASHADDENHHIALIAKIEMLPDKVWRKMLWRYNLDFLSLETFLRRLTPVQTELIVKNWAQYHDGEIPEVLTMTVRDRIKAFFGRYSPEKISDWDTNDESGTRYLSKGAWLDNLAFLDFGFALYVNGTADDEKSMDRSVAKFLSIKNHVNDFVVNLDDGIYWFFYRFARSTMWVFKDPQKVKLGNWICPGFWMTIILNVWFFLGPLAFVGTPSDLKDHKMRIAMILFSAFPVMLWMVLMVIKALISFYKTFGLTLARIFLPLTAVFIVAFCVAVGAGIFAIVKIGGDKLASIYLHAGFLYYNVFAVITILQLLYVMGIGLTHLLYKVEFLTDNVSEGIVYEDWLAKGIVSSVLFSAVMACCVYRMQIMHTFLSSARSLASFIYLLVSNGWIVPATFSMFIMVLIIARMSFITDDEEKKFKRWQSWLIGVSLTSVVFFVLFVIQNLTAEMLSGLGFAIITSLVAGLIVWAWIKAASFTIEKSQKVSQFADFFSERSKQFGLEAVRERDRSAMVRMLKKALAKSSYITSQNVMSVLNDADLITRTVFGFQNHRSLALLEEIFEKATGQNMSRLRVASSRIRGELTSDSQLMCCIEILNGKSIEEALTLAKQYEEKQRKESEDSAFMIMLGNVLDSISKFFGDMYRFGRMILKENCPYVQPPQKL